MTSKVGTPQILGSSHDKWVGLIQLRKHMLSKANNIIMATCSKSCLISVKHSSRARAGDTSDSLSSTDVRPLSASGFFFKSFIISSASWLASLVHVRLDSCGPPGGGTATWSWKVQPHPEFVILYQVLYVCT